MADTARLLAPFNGLRPAPGRAAEIAAPPYDVVETDEARAMAEGRPWNFLRVSRAEIEMPDGTDPHAREVYARARDNLRRMIEAGALVRDPEPCFYIYRMAGDGFEQTGIVGAAACDACADGRVRLHEQTRPAKVEDRAAQIEAVAAHTGPVMAAYARDEHVDGVVRAVTERAADAQATTPDGTTHSLWVVADARSIGIIADAFERQKGVYVADGHHRTAAAIRVRDIRRSVGMLGGERFLMVLFPRRQMRVLAYNRVVTEIGGMTAAVFLERIGAYFEVAKSPDAPELGGPSEIGLYLEGAWYALRDRAPLPDGDAAKRIGASILATRLLEPVLGITDPRSDPRVDFVGGARGTAELRRLVDGGRAKAAFAVYPTGIDDLIAVADAGGIMPPKSTWFEPKLADGMISLPIE